MQKGLDYFNLGITYIRNSGEKNKRGIRLWQGSAFPILLNLSLLASDNFVVLNNLKVSPHKLGTR